MSPCWLLVLLCSSPLWQTEGVEGWGISTVPSESECRPYIEKALKEQQPETPPEAVDATGSEHETPPSPPTDQEGSIEETEEATTKESIEGESGDDAPTQTEEESAETATEGVPVEGTETSSGEEVVSTEDNAASTEATDSQEGTAEESTGEDIKDEESSETEEGKEETEGDEPVLEEGEQSTENNENVETTSTEDEAEAGGEPSAETQDDATTEDKTEEEEDAQSIDQTQESIEKEGESSAEAEEQQEKTKQEEETGDEASAEQTEEETAGSEEKSENADDTVASTEENAASEEEAENTGGEVTDSTEVTESSETQEDGLESAEAGAGEVVTESVENTAETTEASKEEEEAPASKEETTEDVEPASAEEPSEAITETQEEVSAEETLESVEGVGTESLEETPAEDSAEASGQTETSEAEEEAVEETPEEAQPVQEAEAIEATPTEDKSAEAESTEKSEEQEQPAEEEEVVKERAVTVEDQLSLEFEVPKVRRQREHIAEILKLTPESAEVEMLLAKTIESTLKELKKLYDSAIKPLEILYKYRDLSNRHFGDPEIFSKPLILFMGPWSGGKSSIINYLLDNEFQTSSLRTGAEPSPAYFNILMWGEREEVLDGTQLAADWTFSGLQKFGQGLLDRLRGLKLNNPILEKVNIVEIPGILEIRKQVERLFPFNDACQWFIDRADIIFLVYDPSKLDVGPETEAILDQLKGREYQTRILLNKADQVKPEELMRVQGTLIWNISPLMSSQEPPILYSTSLWSVPYEQGAPTRLLHAQERAFLRDLRTAVDKRVENKIASARRFAVRVRNHAKMVDCYLTTYYNHKTFFGNRKKVADDIIEHPQDYHIYEGLSTLTNISRYDLPDPEVYRDFFRLNPVYDFQRLSDTCTYFRGCPINRLDVAIAYDLPELVGKYKKQAERVLEAAAAQAAKS